MNIDEKMNQMALLEYRANHGVDTAVKNIHNMFGFHSIDRTTIQRWYTEFEYDHVKKFTNSSDYDEQLITRFPKGTNFMGGLLSQIKVGDLSTTFNTFDGRLGYGFTNGRFFVMDMFHGKFRSIPFAFNPNHYWSIEFIDDNKFLLLGSYAQRVLLYNFNFDTLELQQLDSVQLDDRFDRCYLVLDQLDPDKFVVYSFYGSDVICTGRVVKDTIVLGQVIQLEIEINWAVLRGSKLQFVGVESSTSCKIHELDVETTQKTSVEISTEFVGGSTFDLLNSLACRSAYFWSDRRIYVAYKPPNISWKIAVLHTDTKEWFNINVEVLGSVYKMYVDRNDVLTVVASDDDRTTSFHRFPLKKPDSLVNLAWMVYTRKFKQTGERGRLFLPYTSDLRLQLPKAGEEAIGDQDSGSEFEPDSDQEMSGEESDGT